VIDHSQQILAVPCGSILVGERYRRDHGDLTGLAASIASEGLLQPVGITEENLLVFGERRLLAVRDVLKRTTIAARIVRVSTILAGEYAENEIRKDFAPSERVAIAKALEGEIGNRQGQRTDRQLPDNCPEVVAGTPTRELIASKVGFHSYKTYERAKKVVEKAVDEVLAQMDSGELSISAAAVISEQSPERQIEIAQLPQEEKKAEVRKLRRQDLPTPAEARRQALESGLAILDRNLTYQLPTPESQRPVVERNYAAMTVLDGVRALATCKYLAADIAAAIASLDTPDMDFAGSCRKAAAFLEAINQEIKHHESK
jgi:ParB-like chromosome segregation protein Spo0J